MCDLPPLEALRVFDAAARHLSFTRAAGELFITQSAVSKQVIALEAALATRLFDRRTRALVLTPDGERLARAVSRALAELRSVTSELRGGGEPTLTLATTQAFASFWLIPRLEEFRRRQPGIDIRISADTRMVDLERGGFDCAVRYLQDSHAPADAFRLFGDTVLPVVSPTWLRKSGQPLAKPADLGRHVLLNYEDDAKGRPWLTWPVWLEMAGEANLRPAGSIGFNHFASAIQAAVDGQGVALATHGLVEELLRSGQLLAPLPQRFSTARSYYLVVPEAVRPNPAFAPFRSWLKDQAVAGAGERREPVQVPRQVQSSA